MNWIKVTDQLPEHGKAVLVCYTTHHSNKQVIVVGHYLERFREESRTDEDNYEYREEDDSYYIIEGWHEQQRNWDDYASIYIHEGVVTHWAPLPETPLERINEDA